MSRHPSPPTSKLRRTFSPPLVISQKEGKTAAVFATSRQISPLRACRTFRGRDNLRPPSPPFSLHEKVSIGPSLNRVFFFLVASRPFIHRVGGIWRRAGPRLADVSGLRNEQASVVWVPAFVAHRLMRPVRSAPRRLSAPSLLAYITPKCAPSHFVSLATIKEKKIAPARPPRRITATDLS